MVILCGRGKDHDAAAAADDSRSVVAGSGRRGSYQVDWKRRRRIFLTHKTDIAKLWRDVAAIATIVQMLQISLLLLVDV
jgi:hypothetical protein